MDAHELADGFFQFRGAAMSTSLDLALTEQSEPALDQVEPGGRRGREVQVETRMTRKPSSDSRRLVRPVVVQDQVHIELGRNVGVDGSQERKKLLAAMTSVKLTDHSTGGQVERRKQARGSMPRIVMRAAFRHAGGQRQDRLRSVERLDLALLVHTQHHRLGGRIEVEPDDVADFLDKQRVGGELEGFGAVRLQPEGSCSSASLGSAAPPAWS